MNIYNTKQNDTQNKNAKIYTIALLCISSSMLISTTAANYQVLESNFTTTQEESSSTDFILESGFESIQEVFEGSDSSIYGATPTPLPIITSIPIPIITATPSPSSNNTSTSTSGSGGSNPLIIQELQDRTNNTSLEDEESTNEESTNENNEEDNTQTETTEENNNEKSEELHNTAINIPTTTPLPPPTHYPIYTPQITPQSEYDENSQITKTTEQRLHTEDIQKNIQEEYQEENRIQHEIADIAYMDTMIFSTNDISPLHKAAENSAQPSNTATYTQDNTQNTQSNFLCTISSFSQYAFLLILFLLGMIFQAILHTIFYKKTK